jgi:Flp pilus assembly protein TadG
MRGIVLFRAAYVGEICTKNRFSVHRDARARKRSEKGAVLLEYAFIFIMFLTLIFGICGFGHALFVYHTIDHVAKEATRYATVRGHACGNDGSCVASNSASGTAGPTSTTDIKAFVASITPPSIDSSKFTYSICGTSDTSACAASPAVCSSTVNGVGPLANGSPGCVVSVQVAYPYAFIFPFIPNHSTTTAPCTQPGICLNSKSQLVIVH